jgi:hypothetical protein
MRDSHVLVWTVATSQPFLGCSSFDTRITDICSFVHSVDSSTDAIVAMGREEERVQGLGVRGSWQRRSDYVRLKKLACECLMSGPMFRDEIATRACHGSRSKRGGKTHVGG